MVSLLLPAASHGKDTSLFSKGMDDLHLYSFIAIRSSKCHSERRLFVCSLIVPSFLWSNLSRVALALEVLEGFNILHSYRS